MDNHKIVKLSKNSYLILQKDKKFKYVGVQIVFKSKFSYEKITAYNLLAKIMSNSNRSYPSIELMNQQKDKLYDMELGFSHTYSQNLSLFKIICSYVNPKYIDNPKYENQIFSFIHETIYQPNIENNQFDGALVAIAKELTRNEIAVEKDNVNHHAMLELLQLVGSKKQAISASGVGDKKVLESLNETKLVEYYQDMIHSPFDIYITGDFKYSQMITLIKNYFNCETDKKCHYAPAKCLSEKPIQPRIIYKDVSQAKIALMYTTKIIFDSKDSYAMRILNHILGGGMQSKLFLEVREKQGLCYSIASMYNTSYGYIMINMGVPIPQIDQAMACVQQQIDAMKKGDFTKQDLQRSIDYFVSSIRSEQDQMFSAMNLNMRYRSFNQKFNLEEIIKQYQSITKQDIVNVASQIQYKTHVLLTKKEH